MMDRIMAAMSGGVDSAVTLALLKSKGFDIIGATMRISENMEEAIADAKETARRFNVEHIVFDYRDIFQKTIKTYFIQSYLNGITPNPCVVCNEKIKFGQLIDDALKMGCSHIATGHYADIARDEDLDRFVIRRTHAGSKDQTYFLYRLKQDQLRHILTPLAGYDKRQVREMAKEYGLHVSDKSDSQEICFIQDNDYKSLISSYASPENRDGFFVDLSGKKLGRHKGIFNYTPGQRKGLDMTFGKPAYVVLIDAKRNEVVIGDREDCMCREIYVGDVNLVYSDFVRDGMEVMCKTRSAMEPKKAMLYAHNEGLKVVFDEPAWAPAAGQSAVFYESGRVFGGGIINSVQLKYKI
jgi:tRNA-uridine 2-sulfurtransferase